MAFMIVAVIILLTLVGMFVLNIRYANLKETASELNKQNAVLLASKIANSPEFSCGSAYGVQRSNCIDFDKVMTEFNKSYNDGYSKLNKKNVIRPELYSPKGNIGGHCIISNAKILKKIKKENSILDSILNL